jgi:RimJ/RimL family protein N-acetyltransferase
MDLRIVGWADGDLELLRRLNAPEMTTHLGGPEADDKVLDRHRRYLRLDDGRMFRIVVDGVGVGSVGYWPRQWRGEDVYEVGWSVLPEHQGRGIATGATRAVLDAVRATGWSGWVYAFPSVDHGGSNAVCRKLGFELFGEAEFEYPPGRVTRSHVWGLAMSSVTP